MEVKKILSKNQKNAIKDYFQNEIENLINTKLYDFQEKLGIINGDCLINLSSDINSLADKSVKVLEEQLEYNEGTVIPMNILFNKVLNKKFDMEQYNLYLNDIEPADFISDLDMDMIYYKNNYLSLDSDKDYFFISYYNLDKINLSNFDNKIIIYDIPNNAEITFNKEDSNSYIYGIYGANVDNLTIKTDTLNLNFLSCDIKNLNLSINDTCDLEELKYSFLDSTIENVYKNVRTN